ncbi:hypothetical protein KJ782_04825 [Patescibacteria group bacterium]|nr:hypothetical protein [Patescibacteria group bacterium]
MTIITRVVIILIVLIIIGIVLWFLNRVKYYKDGNILGLLYFGLIPLALIINVIFVDTESVSFLTKMNMLIFGFLFLSAVTGSLSKPKNKIQVIIGLLFSYFALSSLDSVSYMFGGVLQLRIEYLIFGILLSMIAYFIEQRATRKKSENL